MMIPKYVGKFRMVFARYFKRVDKTTTLAFMKGPEAELARNILTLHREGKTVLQIASLAKTNVSQVYKVLQEYR